MLHAPSVMQPKDQRRMRKSLQLKSLRKLKLKNVFRVSSKKYADEPGGRDRGGDLGWFDKTTMVEQFSAVAFKLKKNEISGVVETPFGFHIIMVEDKKAAKDTSLEEASEAMTEKTYH